MNCSREVTKTRMDVRGKGRQESRFSFCPRWRISDETLRKSGEPKMLATSWVKVSTTGSQVKALESLHSRNRVNKCREKNIRNNITKPPHIQYIKWSAKCDTHWHWTWKQNTVPKKVKRKKKKRTFEGKIAVNFPKVMKDFNIESSSSETPQE